MDQRILQTGIGHQDARIRLPDMHIDILATKPKINPHYQAAKAISESRVAEICGFSESKMAKLSQTDFAYMASIVACDADLEELTLVCHWGNWLFLFDDQFDHDHLRDDEAGVKAMVRLLLDSMSEEASPQEEQDLPPLIRLHKDLWKRLQKKAPQAVTRRYFARTRDYCNAAIKQVILQSSKTSITFEEGLNWRRGASGVSPMLPLVEYAYGLSIPDELYDHTSLQAIEQVTIDVVMCHNDIVSYRKEQMEGFSHNLIDLAANEQGLSVEQSMHKLGEYCRERLRDWHRACADIPSRGEEVDSQVQTLIGATKCMMMANLNWSFHTTRYFGSADNRDAARKTLTTHVLPSKDGSGVQGTAESVSPEYENREA